MNTYGLRVLFLEKSMASLLFCLFWHHFQKNTILYIKKGLPEILGKPLKSLFLQISHDLTAIEREFSLLEGDDKFIVTTEKDAVRLLNNPYFPHALKSRIFYVPIKVEFIDEDESGKFTPTLEKTIRNSRLFK